MLEKYAPGSSVEGITDNELHAGVHDHPLTNGMDGEARWNIAIAGRGPGRLPSSAPAEAVLQDDTPNEFRGNLDPDMVWAIYDHFEKTRWKFAPRIISYLETHPFSDKTSINAIFEKLHQVIENSSIGNIFAASDSQMDLPSGPGGNI